MAAPSALLALLLALLSSQSPVAGMRQQAGAKLGGGGGGGDGGARPSAYPALRFRADQTFKILQLTDLHYGEDRRLDERSDKAGAGGQCEGKDWVMGLLWLMWAPLAHALAHAQ